MRHSPDSSERPLLEILSQFRCMVVILLMASVVDIALSSAYAYILAYAPLESAGEQDQLHRASTAQVFPDEKQGRITNITHPAQLSSTAVQYPYSLTLPPPTFYTSTPQSPRPLSPFPPSSSSQPSQSAGLSKPASGSTVSPNVPP